MRTSEGGQLYTVGKNGEILPVGMKIYSDGPDGPTTGTVNEDGTITDTKGTTSSSTIPPTDYSHLLQIYGLPSDVQNKVNAIFANTPDVNQATLLAMAYVRGTPWYSQTYPGIQEGIAKGIVSNEADYRNYLTQLNTLSQQYNGRDISGAEVAGYLQQGYNPTRVANLFQGATVAKVNGGDWRYLTGAFDNAGPLTSDEAIAAGNQSAGIDTELGQRVQRRLALAQQRMQTIFNGQLATGNLSLGNGRLSSPSLGSGDKPDIAA